MKTRPIMLAGSAALACVIVACSGSNRRTPEVTAPTSTPRIASTVIGGDSDGLAAELLLAGARRGGGTWHGEQRPIAPTSLGLALDAMALDHLRSTVLGGGGGPALIGSDLVAGLATAANAPPDRNGRFGNLDEALQAEAERVTAFAAAVPPALAAVPFLPWRTRSAELDVAFDPTDNATWQTRALGDDVIDLAQVAHFLELRITAARRLLLDRWRGRYGQNPDAGALGLLAMQQVLAAEKTLFQYGFTAGGALGPLANAREYDPTIAPRWLPRQLRIDPDPTSVGTITGLRAIDGASDLAALGNLLRIAADLSVFAQKTPPLSQPELFRGSPFPPAPTQAAPPSISWSREIRALLTHRCGQCHLQQTFGGFSITSYESMRRGGNKTRQFNLQFIVPGNAAASLLPQILTGPPAPFVQMPFVGVILPAEVASIVAWIDGGALKDPLVPPNPPRPGDDLAVVSFRNLVALHLDAATGALHHRREADGPSGIATAIATGRALRGLAEFVRHQPDAAFGGRDAAKHLERAADFAASQLLDAEGRAFDAVELATGRPLGPADLAAHAALTSGLLAVAALRPAGEPLPDAARRATAYLLAEFGTGDGHFQLTPGAGTIRYRAATLTELLTALRLAERADVVEAGRQRALLLLQLRPALAFAEWDRDGEVFGDGIADTDGDGVPEPLAAGSPLGRLPLLADHVVVRDGEVAATPVPTWSADVRPLLELKCGECHMNGNQESNYSLDTRRQLATPGESAGRFDMLVPGDPEASFLFRKIASRQPGLGAQMPRGRPPLDAAGVELVRRWILTGASAQ